MAASKTLPGRLSQNRKAHRPHKMLKSHGLFNQFKTCSEKQGEIDGVMNALRIQCLQGGKTVIPGFWNPGLRSDCLSAASALSVHGVLTRTRAEVKQGVQ